MDDCEIISSDEEIEIIGECGGDTRLVTILNDAQDVTFDRTNGIRMCREMIHQASKNKALARFIEQFRIYLEELLVVKTSVFPSVTTMIDFLVELLIDLDRNDNESYVKDQLLLHVISHFRANSDEVRLRVCEIAHKYLQALNDKTALIDLDNDRAAAAEKTRLDAKVFNKIRNCLVERIRDPNMNVQLEAISASSFLQSPDEQYCPVINGFMSLLRHDSLQLVRILILDFLALNKATFALLKDELIFDTNPDVRNKVIKVFLKKVSNKYMDDKLKRAIVEAVLADDNKALLGEVVAKWLTKSTNRHQSLEANRVSILQFVKNLNLANVWYQNEQTSSIVGKEQKLYRLMKAIFEQQSLFENIAEFNDTSSGIVFESLEAAFHLKSLVYYCFEAKQISRFNTKSSIQANLFYFDIAEKLSFIEEITPAVDLLYYQLFEASFFLDSRNFEEKLAHFTAFILSSSIRTHQPDLLIYQAVLTKLDGVEARNKILDQVWNYYSLNQDDLEQVKKCLGILFTCVSQLSQREYEDSLKDRLVEDESSFQDETMPVFLFKHMLLTTIQSQDPSVRALTVRIMGIFTMLDTNFIELAFPIFFNAIAHDFPQVVVESQKVFFNIIMGYSSSILSANQEVVGTVIRVLRMQMNCLDESVRFVAFEGFAKLLLTRAIKNDEILFKIFLTHSAIDFNNPSKLSLRRRELKACLSTFLYHYFRKNPSQLVKMFEKYLSYGLEKNIGLKCVANYVYYLTSAFEKPQLKLEIMGSILDQMTAKTCDFQAFRRLIEPLLEFSLCDSEVDWIDKDEIDKFNEQLSVISANFQALLTKLRGEKWKLSREPELKDLAQKVSRLAGRQTKTRTAVKRTRPVSMITIDDSDTDMLSIKQEETDPDIYQFQNSRASNKSKIKK